MESGAQHGDIRLRYLDHVEHVKGHLIAAFKEQTDWLTLHLDQIRQRYPRPIVSVSVMAGSTTASAKKKKKGDKKDKVGRKSKKSAKQLLLHSDVDENRPAFNDLIKSPRKRPNHQLVPPSPGLSPPKLALLSADNRSPAKKSLSVSTKNVSASEGIKRATSPLSPRQVPVPSVNIFAAPAVMPSYHGPDKENHLFSPPGLSAAASKGSSSSRSRERERTPSSIGNVLSPPASRGMKSSQKASSPAPVTKTSEPEPAVQTAKELSAIVETSEESEPAAPVPLPEEPKEQEVVPEADEDEPPPPPSLSPPALTQIPPPPTTSLLIPSSLTSTLSLTTPSVPAPVAPATAMTIIPTLSHPQHRRTLGTGSTAGHASVTAPLPPSPSSAFLGRLGLAPLPLASRPMGQQAPLVTQPIPAAFLEAMASPRNSVAAPPPLGSLGLSVNKRSSTAAELSGRDGGSGANKLAKVDQAGQGQGSGQGAKRLESVKEALSKMRTQRQSAAATTAALGSSVSASAAPSTMASKRAVTPALVQPRRISPLPNRVKEAAPTAPRTATKPRTSVGDLVKRFEMRRESFEADARRVSTGVTKSQSIEKVVGEETRTISSPKPSMAGKVEMPHPTTTPPGTPPVASIDATEKDGAMAELDEIEELGFEDGMIIEDSVVVPADSLPVVSIPEPASSHPAPPQSVLALAGLGPKMPGGLDADASEVIETRPIEFFDAEDEEEEEAVDPATALAAAAVQEFEEEIGDGDEETGFVGARDETMTQTVDLSVLAQKAVREEQQRSIKAAAPKTSSQDGSKRVVTTSTLRRTPSTTSLASTKSATNGGGGFGGLLSKAGSALATTWTGRKPEVKSLQLAAAAAKKEQEEKERRMVQKEERRLALEKKQADERTARLDEDKRSKAELERRRKEREDAFGRPAGSTFNKPKPPALVRVASEEPAKKRKVDETPSARPAFIEPVIVKKVRPVAPETPNDAAQNQGRVLKQTATFQPSRPPTAKADGIRVVSNKPSSAVKKPMSSTSSMHGIGKLLPNQTLAVNPTNVWPPPATSAAAPKTPAAATKSAGAGSMEKEPYVELPSIDSEYSDDDEAERERKNAALPDWAQSPYLREALEAQSRIDPGTIFGPIPDLKMEELFRGNKTNKFRMRTSSANWSGPDGLSAYEEAEYARRMGYSRAAAGPSSLRREA